MNESKSKSSLEDIKNAVEVIGKVTLGVVAVCYVIGLVVVNVYLNKYGIYSLSLLRLNYISAGIWALIPILIPLSAILIIRLRSEVSPVIFWGYLLSFIPLLSVLVPVAIALRFDPSPYWLLVIFTGIYLSLLLIMLAESIKEHLYSKDLSKHVFIGVLPVLIIIVSHTAIFANSVYGTIPSQIGGGSPKKVQFIVAAENEVRKALTDSGVLFTKNESQQDTNKTEPVLLLFVTDQECVVLIKGASTAVSIRRDMVKTILYENV